MRPQSAICWPERTAPAWFMLRNPANDSTQSLLGRETDQFTRGSRRRNGRPGRDVCRECGLAIEADSRTSFNDLRDITTTASAHTRQAARYSLSDSDRVAGRREARVARRV